MNVLKSLRNRFDPGAAAVVVTTMHKGGEEERKEKLLCDSLSREQFPTGRWFEVSCCGGRVKATMDEVRTSQSAGVVARTVSTALQSQEVGDLNVTTCSETPPKEMNV